MTNLSLSHAEKNMKSNQINSDNQIKLLVNNLWWRREATRQKTQQRGIDRRERIWRTIKEDVQKNQNIWWEVGGQRLARSNISSLQAQIITGFLLRRRAGMTCQYCRSELMQCSVANCCFSLLRLGAQYYFWHKVAAIGDKQTPVGHRGGAQVKFSPDLKQQAWFRTRGGFTVDFQKSRQVKPSNRGLDLLSL